MTKRRNGMTRVDLALMLLIGAGLAAAVPQLARRSGVERANRTVALVVDGADVARVAAGGPWTVAAAMKRLAGSGATAVAVSERTLEDLQASGQVQVAAAGGGMMELRFADRGLARQVEESLRAKFPSCVARADRRGVVFTGGADVLRDVGLALPMQTVDNARGAGLGVVVRLRDYPGVTPSAIDFMVRRAEAEAWNSGRLVVFEGNEVLGHPGLVREVARALELPRKQPSESLVPGLYGAIELAQQFGDAQLGRLLKGREVRVHSISAEEMARMSTQSAVRRFARAARERNVRVCYVRLFQGGEAALLEYNVKYVRALAGALRGEGFELGQAQPFEPLRVPLGLAVVMQAGVVAAGVLLLRRVLPVGEAWSMGLLVSGCVLLGGLMASGKELGPKAAALLAALAFPSLGMMLAAKSFERARQDASAVRAVVRGGGLVWGASAWSLAGGLYVGALLADRMYMMKVSQFMGIKASSVLPLALIAAVVVGKMAGERGGGHLVQVRENLRSFFARPVLLWQVTIALAVAAVAVFFVMRTGNEAVTKPSASELGMRDTLEELLVARPRTKEFMVGHPALMTGAALAGTGWGSALLVAGTVGQVSVTNTFCHLHTPLWLSLLRVFNGLWVGTLIGAALSVAVTRLRAGKQPAGAA